MIKFIKLNLTDNVTRHVVFVSLLLFGTMLLVQPKSIVSASTPPDNCFNFDSGTGTIIDYYDYEDNDNQNSTCTRDVDIPSSIGGETVTSIGDYAFRNSSLSSVTIPSTVTVIGNSAFAENQLNTITIPNSVTIISEFSFGFNNLTNLTIPNSVTYIGRYAFQVNDISNLTLGNSVTEINEGAFIGNNLIDVTIPDSVIYIDNTAFIMNSIFSKNSYVILFSNADPVQVQALYDAVNFVKLHTIDRNNPNNLEDSIVIEELFGGDFNQNGNQNDIIGGHLINPQVDNNESLPLTYPDPITSSTVTLELPSDVTNGSVSAINPTTIPKDTFFSFPLGLTSFQFDTTVGATKTITLYYDLPGDPSSYTPRKYNENTKTFTTIQGATITRVTYNNKSMIRLTYDITDGGSLDQDNQANGTIIDPVGLAAATVGVPNTGM